MSLAQKTVSGVKWSAINSLATQSVGFIFSIILARLLSPSDYGITGMIAIFIGISTVFIGGGFSSALIRKKNRTLEDYSTVFYYNVGMSILFYIILYLTAPLIANFYSMPILVSITRVSSIGIILSALGSVQSSQFTIRLDFKTPTKISLIALIISGVIGISLAYLDFGVWALVTQSLVSTFIITILYWVFGSWRPLLIFSKSSFRDLFGYGSKLMITGFFDVIYMNAFPLIVGKVFSASLLGFYNRADSLASLPATTLTGIVQKVTFPVMSEIQDDDERLKNNYRRIIKMMSFIVFPIMFLLIVLSKPLVQVLLSDKWLPSVPLLVILCFNWILFPIHIINLNLLQVKGRSDLFLKLDVVKKIMFTIVIALSIKFGIFGMCIGRVITSFLGLFIHTYYTDKLINLTALMQIRDILPFYILSSVVALVTYVLIFFITSLILKLIFGGLVFLLLYLACSYILKFNEITEIFKLLRNKTT